MSQNNSLFDYYKKSVHINKRTIFVISIFALLISILSLVVPIAVQTLVNTIAFGTLIQPIVVLTIIVFIILLAAGSLRICQAIIVENIEQEIFVNLALGLARRLPRLKIQMLDEHRGPELINRFFEVVTVQKAMTVLLIYILEIAIQALTGFILLAIYHPYFLLFDLFLLFSLLLVLYLPKKIAVESAISECDAKHQVAAWLEEYTHTPYLFKLNHNSLFPFIKVDNATVSYLQQRRRHFSRLLMHLGGLYFIYAFFNASLLGIGGYLVSIEQLSLGQLVAAEIVLNAIIYGFIRLGHSLSDIYDLIASLDKLQGLFQLEYEKAIDNSLNLDSEIFNQAPALEVLHLSYKNLANTWVFKDLNFSIKAGETAVFLGSKGVGKSLLINVLLGMLKPTSGEIKINRTPVNIDMLLAYRKQVAIVKDIEIVNASLYENLVLAKKDITLEKLYQYFYDFELSEAISKLPEGIHSSLINYRSLLSSSDLQKLMFIRAILVKPVILLIDGALDGMTKHDIDLIVKVLNNLQRKTTILITSRHEYIADMFAKKIYL